MIKDRVQQYCKYKNMGISRFEKLAGLSNGYFNQVTKRPSDNSLLKISKAHPDLNLAWLLTGTGSMLEPADHPIHGNVTRIGNISGTTNSPTTVNNNGSGESADLMRVIEELKEQNKSQREQIRNLTDIIKNLTAR
nr:MAG TPA: repressor protein CI [Caudoviricetes sp.]